MPSGSNNPVKGSKPIFSDKTRNIGGKAGMAIAVFDGAKTAVETAKQYYNNNFVYSVKVTEKDILFEDVHTWLVAVTPEEKHKSLIVSSGHNNRSNALESDDTQSRRVESKPLIVRFDDQSSRKIVIEGYSITVVLNTPERSEMKYEQQPATIVFTSSSYLGQQAVLRQLEKINNARKTSRRATLKIVNQWGHWTTRADLPARSLESVSMPEEQSKRILEDLSNFLEAEPQYNRLAIPWHRGYMLHGPPGTGKTSLVRALASELNLDLWYISLSDLSAESSLLALMSDVGPRSILLLEDIDTIKITHDRDGGDTGKISMSSLLNTLDGAATPHGLITFMTTNRFDILDEALTRAGRMDMIEMLDYPLMSTVAKLYKHFYSKNIVWPVHMRKKDILLTGISTAQISEVFKRHMLDSVGAQKALMELLKPIFSAN